MENRYKIILSGNQIYKEAELPADMERVTVGTGIDCTVRLRRDLFFESIQIEFVKESGGWRATCSDNIYFTEGDIRKYMTRKVIRPDVLLSHCEPMSQFPCGLHLQFSSTLTCP